MLSGTVRSGGGSRSGISLWSFDVPLIVGPRRVALPSIFFGSRGRIWINSNGAGPRGKVEFVVFFEHLAGAVEGVFEPEIGGEGMFCGGGNDAVLDGVAFFEAEDAGGFDADVVIYGKIFDGGIRRVGNGAGKEFGGTAVGMADADQRNFYLLEGAVVIEGEAGELAGAEEIVDFDDGMDFFAGVAVGFEADARFEKLDLEGESGLFRGWLREGWLFLCRRGACLRPSRY